jgi:hypothetical protein
MTTPNFSNLNLLIPNSISYLSYDKQLKIYNYLEQLNDFDKKTYTIAINHLGTSFDILRSNGYISWIKTQQLSYCNDQKET